MDIVKIVYNMVMSNYSGSSDISYAPSDAVVCKHVSNKLKIVYLVPYLMIKSKHFVRFACLF